MKAIITVLFLFISVILHSQSEMKEEMEVSISMKLESVSSVLFLSNGYVEVANTEHTIFNYYDRYIELNPGIHRIKLEITEPVMVVLMSKSNLEVESQSSSSRVIKNGIDQINWDGRIITRDYIEWTICDYFIERKIIYKN